MFEVVFNKVSAAEMSALDTLSQLELMDGFQFTKEELSSDGEKFGILSIDNRKLYRYRLGDYRIYFEIDEKHAIVHRVLHKNTLSDFAYRTNPSDTSEDETLQSSKHFWSLIDEGKDS